jgi:3-oxoacyl-[acyl-carrier-protein] synthase-1
MSPTFVISDNIITSLGFSTSETIANIRKNYIGLKIVADTSFSPVPVPLSFIDTPILEEQFRQLLSHLHPEMTGTRFTRMEKMLLLSIYDAIRDVDLDLSGERTILIFSTTKGNIDLLEAEKKSLFDENRVFLWELADVIKNFYHFYHPPLIVSNACISGSMAIGTAYRYIRSGLFDHAVVTGGDILTKFVVSGFQSFQSLSPEPCKPFDSARNGLSLGEGCGTLVLTSREPENTDDKFTVEGFATSNDANHISGPSRTGEELFLSIRNSLKEANLEPSSIDFISAHGTATPFNDEMESKALSLAKLNDNPVNSFKGYWGHTLGAAGLIESIATIHSMKENTLFRSAGFNNPGVPEKINVITVHQSSEVMNALKIASGFGGCNSSLVFRKHSSK